MKIVVPMAGQGTRFLAEARRNPEYSKPKPIIDILGKPMVAWAIESLPFVKLPGKKVLKRLAVTPEDLIFICLREHEESHRISKVLKEQFTDGIKIVFLDGVTRGTLETVLAAKNLIDSDEEIIFSDSDHYFDGKYLYKEIFYKDEETVGIIPIFKPPDAEVKWSYTLFNRKKVALAVGEKDADLAARGAYANIGGYYFVSGKMFVSEAEATIREGKMSGTPGKKEFYVAPLYDRLIRKGMKVKVAITPEVWGLGTPKDVEYFEKTFPTVFFKEK